MKKEPILDPNLNSSNALKIAVIFIGYVSVILLLTFILLPYKNMLAIVPPILGAIFFPIIPVKLMNAWCADNKKN